MRIPGIGEGARLRLWEGLTIVVGVVAALAVDAGWAWVADRREEREILTSLRTELRAAARELQADQDARLRIQERTWDLLEAAPDDLASGGPVLLDAHVMALMDYRFFTPPRSVLDDLMSSGRLSLIRADEVRFAILGYAQEATRLTVVEEREMEFAAEQMEPWLRDRVPLPDRLDYNADPADPALARAMAAALEDPAFRNVLRMRWNRTDTSLRFARGLEDRIRRALDAIDGVLPPS